MQRSITLLFAITLSLFYLAACAPEIGEETTPIKALSMQSAMIVETGNIKAAKNAWMQNTWMQTFADDKTWTAFTEELSPLETIGDSLMDVLSHKRLFFSVELIGKSSFGILAATNIDDKTWKHIAKSLGSAANEYAGETIYSATQGETKLHISYLSNVLLCSPHRVLIEDGLRRLKSDYALNTDEQFTKMRSTSNRKDHFNVYVQYSEFTGLVNALLKDAKSDYMPNVSQWTALDVNLTNNGILLSGLSDMGDSLPSYLDGFNDQRAPKIQSSNIVPSSAALWINFSTNNFLKHLRMRDALRESKGTARRFNEHLDRIGVDFTNAFSRWVDHEYGLIYLNTSNHPRHKRVAFFSIRDAEGFMDAFSPVLDLDISGIQFRGETIYSTKHHNWLRALVGRAFNAFEARVMWVYNDHVFFAPTTDILTEFMTDVLDERTLSKSLPYRQFSGKIPDRAAIQITLLPNQAEGLINDYIPKSWASTIKRNETIREHTPYVSLQFQPQGKMAFTGLYMAYRSEVEQVVKPVWSADIPAPIVAGPFLLKNHYNQQNEIAVQDQNDVLYLFGSTGKLLWKTSLKGRIMGNVSQVDLYRNGKLQMAFNTPEYIYVLDRNGNPVDPFPAKAPSTITSPMAVFDYDKARNYRFIFACGNNIYNWDKKASDVKGWELNNVNDKVTRTPSHHVAGNKDYLVFITDNGRAYLTDRRGRVRVPSVLELPENHTGPYSVQVNTAERTIQLANITLDNELITVLSSGKKDITRLGRLPEQSQMTMWNDQMLIFGEKQLEWKDANNPLSIELEQHVSGYPQIFGKDKPQFFAVAGIENQIYIYDEHGKLMSGFPVYGTEKMILGNLFPSGGSVYMTTATPENKLVVYLIQ